MKEKENTKNSKQLKIDTIFKIIKQHKVTNYEISHNTGISEAGLGSITNGDTKNPRNITVDAIYDYLISNYPINSHNIDVDVDYKRPKGKSSIAIHDIQTLPLYDSTATLGLVEIFNNTENGNVIDHISIPNLPKSDGAIFMTGDSMYPLLKSGDIIALKIINPADIIYGEMYYVEYYGSDESSVFKVVKYVKKSDLDKDYIQLVSYNTHHDPTDILKNRIKTIAIVNASIRYNRLG
ncbi:TPA: S24 family peptidase [Elizabethkingia anophelis]